MLIINLSNLTVTIEFFPKALINLIIFIIYNLCKHLNLIFNFFCHNLIFFILYLKLILIFNFKKIFVLHSSLILI